MNWIVLPIPKLADQFRLPKETFFDVICMSIIGISIFNGNKFFYRNKYLAWLAAWVFITIFLNWHAPYTNTYENIQKINYITIAPTLHFVLGLWATTAVMTSLERKDFITIGKAICLSAAITSVYGILQTTGLDPAGKLMSYTDFSGNRFSGLMGQQSLAGYYLAISAPLFLIFKEKKYWMGFFLVVTGIILCKSTMALVGLGVGVSVYILLAYRNKYVYIGFGLLLIAGIVLAVNYWTPEKWHKMLNGRQEYWQIAVNHLKDNPLFGQGLGIFGAFGEQVKGKFLLHPHCDWLLLIIEIGLLGVFFILLTIINSIRMLTYDIKNRIGFAYLGAFIGFLAIMAGSFVIVFAPCALLGLVLFWGVEKC